MMRSSSWVSSAPSSLQNSFMVSPIRFFLSATTSWPFSVRLTSVRLPSSGSSVLTMSPCASSCFRARAMRALVTWQASASAPGVTGSSLCARTCMICFCPMSSMSGRSCPEGRRPCQVRKSSRTRRSHSSSVSSSFSSIALLIANPVSERTVLYPQLCHLSNRVSVSWNHHRV